MSEDQNNGNDVPTSDTTTISPKLGELPPPLVFKKKTAGVLTLSPASSGSCGGEDGGVLRSISSYNEQLAASLDATAREVREGKVDGLILVVCPEKEAEGALLRISYGKDVVRQMGLLDIVKQYLVDNYMGEMQYDD